MRISDWSSDVCSSDLLDSLTRVAHAQREIGLALGEQPTARGYPPSVISLLPNLIERAGNDAKTGGSITAFYTVPADGDDTVGDPVVDTARALLDGHIVLSRAQAARGVYPAVDIAASIPPGRAKSAGWGKRV